MSAYNITSARRRTSSGGAGWMVAIFLLAAVPMTLFNGWMLSIMWNWFIPHIFSSMPTLSIGAAIGLSLVISAFVYIPAKEAAEDEDPWVRFVGILLNPVLRGLLLLAIGAIVHSIAF